MSDITIKIKGSEIKLDYLEASNKFINDFKGMIHDYRGFTGDEKKFLQCYSYLASDKSMNYEKDLYIIESDFYDLGWDESALSKLFRKYSDKITKELLSESIGSFDLFLYKWIENEFPLGGYTMDDIIRSNDHDDILVKFSYGWHETSYGKLFLEQSDCLDNFIEIVTKILHFQMKYIFDRIITRFDTLRKTLNISGQMNELRDKFYKFISIESNIINVQIQKYLEAINLVFYLNVKGSSGEYFTLQQIQKEFELFLDSYRISPQKYKMDISGEILKIKLLK